MTGGTLTAREHVTAARAKVAPFEVSPEVVTVHPAVQLYSYGFEVLSITDGWVWAGTPGQGNVANVSWTLSGSTRALRARRASTETAGADAAMERVITGLTPGRPHTLTAWVSSGNTSIPARLGVVGIGQAADVNVGSTAGGNTLSYTFTPTADTHTMRVSATRATTGSAFDLFMDDPKLTRDGWTDVTPAVISDTIELGPADGRVQLDMTRAPYVRAQLTVPLIDAELLELLDPKDQVRIELDLVRYDLGSSRAPQSARSLDLSLVGRVIDHNARTIELDAQSDECLLIGYRLTQTTPDVTPTQHQESLRAILDHVLGKIGAQLEPGTVDARFPVLEAGTNLFPDPGTAATPQGTYGASGATVDFNDASWSISGDGDSFSVHTPTNSDSYLYYNPGLMPPGMSAGKTYTFSATGNVKTLLGGTVYAGRDRRLCVFYRPAGGGAYTMVASPQVPNVVGQPTRVAVTFTLPADTTEVLIRFYLGATVGAIRWDGFRLSENRGTPGVSYDDYWDGDTPDTPDYVYAWSGIPDGSSSTRTPALDLSPELLVWTPGDSAAEFIAPLLTYAGLRLYSTGSRWYLIGPDHTVPGRLTLAADNNVTEARDSVSLADADGWHDAVVIRYRWRDLAGVQQERVDIAGTGQHVLLIEYGRPYPGPGAAAYVLGRLQGQGRVQAVTALTDFSAEPAQEVAISLPATISQTGQVSGVVFDLTARVMHVTSRGLTDTPPESWLSLEPGETWNDSAAGATWIGEAI